MKRKSPSVLHVGVASMLVVIMPLSGCAITGWDKHQQQVAARDAEYRRQHPEQFPVAFADLPKATQTKVTALLAQAKRLHDSGDFAAAERTYTEGLSLYPTSVQCLVGRGWARGEQRKYKEAEADFELARRINAKIRPATTQLAVAPFVGKAEVYVARQWHKEAADQYMYAINHDQSDARLWYGHGLSLFRSVAGNPNLWGANRSFNQARESLEKAAKLDRNNYDIYMALTLMSLESPRFQGGMQPAVYSESLVRIRPNDPESHAMHARALLRYPTWKDQAVAAARQAASLAPSDPEYAALVREAEAGPKPAGNDATATTALVLTGLFLLAAFAADDAPPSQVEEWERQRAEQQARDQRGWDDWRDNMMMDP